MIPRQKDLCSSTENITEEMGFGFVWYIRKDQNLCEEAVVVLVNSNSMLKNCPAYQTRPLTS